VVDVLADKTIEAARGSQAETIMISGGVAANNRLRAEFKRRLDGRFKFLAPGKEFCTDNAAMTGFAGWLNWQNFPKEERKKCLWSTLKADPNLSLS
jgi:N6-L-threonylcarbamoyladenine synthase